MKRGALISLLCLFFLISCSNDDAPKVPTSLVNAKINGVQMAFTNVTVKEFPYQDNGQNFVDVGVEAKLANDPTKIIRFNIDQGLIGVNEMLVVSYENDGVIYDYRFDQDIADTAILASDVTKNTTSVLQGTFTGTVTYYNSTTMDYESIDITEARYSIYY